MNHFLSKSAAYIFNQHKINELANIAVILPTRRGTVMFKNELGKLSSKAFIAPNVLAVEDFIVKTTGLQLLEPIDLVFELYNSIKKEDENVKFDQFMSWAPTLLKDFETIDQYLVNAKQLFNFMTEAKAMERWNISTLSSKNPTFETSVNKYFELFKTLNKVYENFNKTLNSSGLAYRGSAYRYLAEHSEKLLLDQTEIQKFYFVGFNALSISEFKIMKCLVDAQRAEALWDSDDYYMKSLGTAQLAGKFLKPLKREATLGKNWNWQENNLLTSPKNIQIIGLNHNSQQAKVASHYLKKWATNAESNSKTALVLADETLLDTVLNHIPKEVGGYNITMGISLKASSIFYLFESIFDLFNQTKNGGGHEKKLNTRLIINILNHKLISNWLQVREINLFAIVNNLKNLNQLFISESDLKSIIGSNLLLDIIFKSCQNSPEIAVNQLHKILTILSENTEDFSALELQFFEVYKKVLNRVAEIVQKNQENLSISGLKSMLFEILRQSKLPFESTKNDNLQIMGMLETRTLDFERIILLSANEGNLPSGKKSQSLIPFDALHELDMPTYDHQDAIMAYHFFRLLQHAKEVVILYTKPNTSNGNKEKSRFILQIEHELAKLNTNVTLEYPNLNFEAQKNEKVDTAFTIEKTEEILQKIKTEIAQKGLFATAINEYIKCTMMYYFNRIAKIKEPDEIDENIGNDIFGQWIHKTLELIDIEQLKSNKNTEKGTIAEILKTLKPRLVHDFKSHFSHLNIDEGMNLILLNVAEKVLKGYFLQELKTGAFPQETLAVEVNLSSVIKVNLENEEVPVKIGGKIDKINKIGNAIRIIDYKTGKVEKENIRLKAGMALEDAIESILTQPKLEKYRQLWLYRYLYLKNKSEFGQTNLEGIEAGIYSFRNNAAGFLVGPNYFTNPSETEAEYIEISEKIITDFVKNLLDKTQPFSMTEDLNACIYCTYKNICVR